MTPTEGGAELSVGLKAVSTYNSFTGRNATSHLAHAPCACISSPQFPRCLSMLNACLRIFFPLLNIL